MTAAARPVADPGTKFDSQPATLPQAPRGADKRLALRLSGRFLNELSEEHKLVTLAISCRSVQVRSNVIPKMGDRIVCYFDELGRVAGIVTKSLERGFLLRFATTAHKRDKLADKLTWLINKDSLGLSDERAMPRYPATGPAQVKLPDGRFLKCRVIDISLTGAGFESIGQPPSLGEIVQAGSLKGEVVRSEGTEFGVRFLRGQSA